MCATNPKKKRQHVTKETKAATKDTTLSTGDDSSAVELIYQHVGDTLLAKANGTPQSTAQLLKGKDLVGFYFGASWYVLLVNIVLLKLWFLRFWSMLQKKEGRYFAI